MGTKGVLSSVNSWQEQPLNVTDRYCKYDCKCVCKCDCLLTLFMNLPRTMQQYVVPCARLQVSSSSCFTLHCYEVYYAPFLKYVSNLSLCKWFVLILLLYISTSSYQNRIMTVSKSESTKDSNMYKKCTFFGHANSWRVYRIRPND